jgi:hypothetical protein
MSEIEGVETIAAENLSGTTVRYEALSVVSSRVEILSLPDTRVEFLSLLETDPEKPRVIKDLPFSWYKETGFPSHSTLEGYKKSPYHGRFLELNGKEESTPSQKIGEAAHAGALGLPIEDSLKLTPLQKKQVDGIVAALTGSATFRSLINGAEKELSLSYTLDGLRFRSRFDIYNPALSLIADIKTCTDASPVAFRWAVAKYGYHRKEAIYREAARLCGLPVEHFVFIAVENRPPYAVAFYTLSDQAKKDGEEQASKLLTIYKDCRKSQSYPAFSDEIQVLEWFPVKETAESTGENEPEHSNDNKEE